MIISQPQKVETYLLFCLVFLTLQTCHSQRTAFAILAMSASLFLQIDGHLYCYIIRFMRQYLTSSQTTIFHLWPNEQIFKVMMVNYGEIGFVSMERVCVYPPDLMSVVKHFLQ